MLGPYFASVSHVHRHVGALRALTTSTQVLTKAPSARKLIQMVTESSLSKKELESGTPIETQVGKGDEDIPDWKKQKLALHKKFNGEHWNPKKKLSRDQQDAVRMLKSRYPTMTNSDLADYFKVSPESIRRILKAKWQPNEDEMLEIQERWKRRGTRIEEQLKESGAVPERRIRIASQGNAFRVRSVENPGEKRSKANSSPLQKNLHRLLRNTGK
ncbi:AaceriABL175Cp [[Ashbya] aceris (nom. inval.)]|nr:AaceriABL175Cp [[Ashbya] aceris (nom. inval.)]